MIHPLCIVAWKHGSHWCGTVLCCISSDLWSHTVVRMCTCITTCIYVNLSSEYCSSPLCIVPWKHGYHCVSLCFAVIPLLFPDLGQNVYMHQYMYFCLPDSQCLVPPHLHTYMKRWIPLCGTVCVFQSLYFWSHTLFKMCTCISTLIYVHLTAHVCCTPFEQFHEKHEYPCVTWCVCCNKPIAHLC